MAPQVCNHPEARPTAPTWKEKPWTPAILARDPRKAHPNNSERPVSVSPVLAVVR